MPRTADATAEVIIVGSGLAGMSAAISLVDAGLPVTVLEKHDWIGGRTASWTEDGLPVESGYHRFLGFYSALPDLLNHVGVPPDDILCWEDEVEIRGQDGTAATLGLAPFHKPLKTFWSAFGHNDFLPPADKLALGQMMAAGLKAYASKPLELDKVSVAGYARRHGVSDRTIGNLLTPLTEGLFFVPVTQYSMHNFVGLFAPYMTSLYKLRLGAYLGGMTEVMMQPMATYVGRHGGRVLTGQPVDGLLVRDGKVVGVASAGREFMAGQTVLAASLGSAQQLIRDAFGDDHPHFRDMLWLPSTPSVTFQLELSRPSMELDRTTFGPGTIMASFAEQSRTTFQGSKGRLSIILAEPEKYLDAEPEEILRLVIRDAKKLGIELEGTVLDYHKVVIADDFYSLATGHEALRPPQATPIPGLTLAGDYTKQQYLATMEGAVVSGRQAAEAVRAVL